MSGNQVMFNPSEATKLAEFQGTFAGIQAGNSRVTGVAMAPTSIYNQAGYYALQDSNTGYISLQKLSDDSLYTQNWYDQGTGTIFDFRNGGQGIVSTQTTTTTNNNQQSASDIAGAYSNNNTTTTQTQQYPHGTGYQVQYKDTQNTATEDAQNGEQKELTAADIEELVDAGIYSNSAEALNASIAAGYTVNDAEQAKLGLYSSEDEKKIKLMMDKYGLTRQEAVSTLGNTIAEAGANEQSVTLREALDSVQDEQGFIGNAWNGFKNLFDVGVSSEDAEYAIQQYEAGEISYDEALNVIEEYAEKQGKVTGAVKSAAAVTAGVLVGAATGGIGGVVIGAAAGAAAKTGMGALDRGTNKIDDDVVSGQMLTDAGTGAIEGGVASIGGKLLKGVGKGLKSVGGFFKGLFK